MTTTNINIRQAHKLLDYVAEGRAVLDEEVELLRSFLPELPKQKTLEEIIIDVRGAWTCTSGNDWGGNSCSPNISIEYWLGDLYAQLKGLEDAGATVPALPEGMRIADHADFGRVVVSPGAGIDRCHEIFYLDPGMMSGTDISAVESDSLTFIDSEPAKLAFLETEEDYESAPFGTIAVGKNYYPWTKTQSSWLAYGAQPRGDFGMRACRRRVLRWGLGE